MYSHSTSLRLPPFPFRGAVTVTPTNFFGSVRFISAASDYDCVDFNVRSLVGS
ncbi:unnamed protein product [Penicillium camemberti]|uniref:Str. FM013 n=1 Tax=Penicillium camemberti (strain FM 013) TaxID=1429867 RepID=A0A0G4NUA5_PENC3|nr:unnamed protein product [Penicillium camemberti]